MVSGNAPSHETRRHRHRRRAEIPTIWHRRRGVSLLKCLSSSDVLCVDCGGHHRFDCVEGEGRKVTEHFIFLQEICTKTVQSDSCSPRKEHRGSVVANLKEIGRVFFSRPFSREQYITHCGRWSGQLVESTGMVNKACLGFAILCPGCYCEFTQPRAHHLLGYPCMQRRAANSKVSSLFSSTSSFLTCPLPPYPRTESCVVAERPNNRFSLLEGTGYYYQGARPFLSSFAWECSPIFLSRLRWLIALFVFSLLMWS